MSSLTLSKVSINYHSGRFKLTMDDINNAMVELKSETSPTATAAAAARPIHVKSMFAALPQLALKADKAMCIYRSHATSSSIDEVIMQEQISIARDNNDEYMMALEGVICSMYLSLQSNQSVIARDAGHNRVADVETDEDSMLIDSDRLQTAMAVITTAIASSWLHLQTQGIAQQISQASTKLRRGISLAACCFVAQNPKCFRLTWMEGLSIIQRACSRAETSALYAPEVERMSLALRHLKHALSLVELTTAPRSTSGSQMAMMVKHTEKNAKKRQRGHESETSEKRIKSIELNCSLMNDDFDSDDTSKLALQESIVNAMQHHVQGSRGNRDGCMRKAMGIESGGMAGKLKVLFEAIDFLDLTVEDAKGFMDRSTDFIQSLSSLSTLSMPISCLLGCVYAKVESHDKALASFASVIQLHKDTQKGNLSDYKDAILNTAHCCIEKGDIDVALEVLLHWIDVEEDTSKNPIENTDHVQPCTVYIDSDKQLHSSKVLRVLYHIFFAASVTNDWDTCQSARDALGKLSTDEILPLAKMFVNLERLGPTERDTTEQFQSENAETLYSIGILMYQAESRLLNLGQELSHVGNASARNNEESFPKEIDQLLTRMWAKVKLKNEIPVHLQNRIESCIYNNIGISSMSKGMPMEAMSNFLQAIKSLQDDNFLPVFNLSLALWCQGSKQEACRLYLEKRGFKANLISAQQGEKESLSLDLDKAQIDLEAVKNRRKQPGSETEEEFLALDICMMKYILH